MGGRALKLYREAFQGLPLRLWALCAVVLVNRAGTMVHGFLLLFMKEVAGYDTATQAFHLSLYGAGSIAGALAGGWVTPRLGPKPTMIIALAGAGASFLVMGEASGLLFSSMVFAAAFFGDAFRPAGSEMVVLLSPPQRLAQGFALMRLAVNVGMTVGPALGGWFIVNIGARHGLASGYAWLFRCDGLTSIAACVALIAGARRLRGEESVEPAASEEDEKKSSWPLRDGPFLIYLAVCFLQGVVFLQMFGAWSLHMKGPYGLDEAQIGLLWSLNTVMIVLFEMVLTHRVRGRSAVVLVALGGLLSAVSFGFLTLGTWIGLAILHVFVMTLGEMVGMPFLNIVVSGHLSRRQRGPGMGMLSASFGLAGICGPSAGVWVYTNHGPNTLFLGLVVIGCLSTWWLVRTAPRLEKRKESDDAA